jgi:hypothetical protein
MLMTLLLTGGAVADDPIVTRAMTASTIVEMFLEEGELRVELEIGLRDLQAFGNLLPDELHQRLGNEPEPLAERLLRFFREDWVLRVEGGAPVPGRVAEILGRRRLLRDLITGETLPNQAEEGETVLFAVLHYPLPGQPKFLSIEPPMLEQGEGAAANVGFVVYHRGLPVNDFRYLAGEEILDLDWEDPWFSSFRTRALKRQFAAPIMAFLYVEFFEVRKEIVMRPKDLQDWVDLGLEGKEIIRAEDWEVIKQKVVEFLMERNPVLIDGERIEPELDRIHFLRRSLRQTGVIDPPEDLPIHAATLGVIFRYPTGGLPERVTMDWELFSPRFPKVPSAASDEAGGLPMELTAEEPVLVWENFLTNPKVPGMIRVLAPPERPKIALPLGSAIFGALFLLLGFRLRRQLRAGQPLPRGLAAAGAAALLAGILCIPYARVDLPSPIASKLAMGEARVVLGSLLHNIYRAFDLRDEGRIYDTLTRSVSGDLLADVYLETQRSLELENQGGARAKLTDVEMLQVQPNDLRWEEGGALAFDVRSTWIVTGSVGHWGHIHQRRNQYDARLTIRSVDGTWKITALELLDELRITRP